MSDQDEDVLPLVSLREDSENGDDSNSDESDDEDQSGSGDDDSDDDSDEDVPLKQKHTRSKVKNAAARTTAARSDGELLERRWTACNISPTLRDSIEQLGGEERCQRIVDIVEVNDFELARKEQIASNQAVLRSIMAGVPAPPPASSTMPTTSRVASPPLISRSAPQAQPSPISQPSSAPPPPAMLSAPLVFRTVNPDDWPAWLNEAYTYLSDAQLGDNFEAALVAWTKLEHAYEFETVRTYKSSVM